MRIFFTACAPAAVLLAGVVAAGCASSTDEPRTAARAEADTPGPSAPAAADPPAQGDLGAYVSRIAGAIDSVPADRQEPLQKIADFVQSKRAAGETPKLVFICTHNSRRSHMGQLWAAAAAGHYGIDGVETYSGGTEATAFNPRAVAALRRAGMQIDAPPGEADNPRYTVALSPDGPTLEAFSKTFADPPNPTEDFAAIMTCSEADRACPFVKGAALRVALPYVDPKEADGTPHEAATYDERSAQIATEMFWLFSRVDPET